jgi:hypothetical protein
LNDTLEEQKVPVLDGLGLALGGQVEQAKINQELL